MARLNNLDGGRSVFVPTEFQAHFAPEVGGDAWSADLLSLITRRLWKSRACCFVALDSAKYCGHVDCVTEQSVLRAQSTSWRTPPPAAPQMDSRLSSTFPLTVSTTSSRPPFPIRPSTLRPPRLPLTDRGKSVLRRPFTERNLTSAFILPGISSFTEPFTVLIFSVPAQSALPMLASIDPFTEVIPPKLWWRHVRFRSQCWRGRSDPCLVPLHHH